MGFKLSSVSHKVVTPAEQVTGCTQLFWVTKPTRKVTPTDELSDFVRIDSIGFYFTAMNGFHVKFVADDKVDVVFLTKIRAPNSTCIPR